MHHQNKIINDDQKFVATSSATTPLLFQQSSPSSSSLLVSLGLKNVYIPENIFNGNTIDYATDDTNDNDNHSGHASKIIVNNNDNNKHQMITARPIIIYENRQTTDGAYNNNNNQMKSNNEKGYFEKTIFNKNGIFIEKIRKIADIDDTNNNVIDNSDLLSHNDNNNNNKNNKNNSNNNNNKDDDDDDEDDMENINRKRIELMNVPLSQHYVITSSGKIEKTDTLASSDVIEQFRDGLNNDYRQQLNKQIISTATTSAIDIDFVAAVAISNTTTATPSLRSTLSISSHAFSDTSNRPTLMSSTNNNMPYDSSTSVADVTHFEALTTINQNGTSTADANKQELNCLVMGK